VLAKRKPPFEALWSHETFGLEAATWTFWLIQWICSAPFNKLTSHGYAA
jgi:hypothetical protein